MTTRTTRKRWSTKKKAQVLTVGTMVFLIALIILIPRAFAYGDPAHCYGYSDCYSIGQTRGQTNGYNDYWSYGTYNPYCPSDESHSKAYCNGYYQGYYGEWKYLAWHGTRFADKVHQLQNIGQSSNVRINGDNNRITVNQGASNNAANGAGGGSSSNSSGNGFQPQCKALCSVIKIGGR
jgi:hypothetical protein